MPPSARPPLPPWKSLVPVSWGSCGKMNPSAWALMTPQRLLPWGWSPRHHLLLVSWLPPLSQSVPEPSVPPILLRACTCPTSDPFPLFSSPLCAGPLHRHRPSPSSEMLSPRRLAPLASSNPVLDCHPLACPAHLFLPLLLSFLHIDAFGVFAASERTLWKVRATGPGLFASFMLSVQHPGWGCGPSSSTSRPAPCSTEMGSFSQRLSEWTSACLLHPSLAKCPQRDSGGHKGTADSRTGWALGSRWMAGEETCHHAPVDSVGTGQGFPRELLLKQQVRPHRGGIGEVGAGSDGAGSERCPLPSTRCCRVGPAASGCGPWP